MANSFHILYYMWKYRYILKFDNCRIIQNKIKKLIYEFTCHTKKLQVYSAQYFIFLVILTWWNALFQGLIKFRYIPFFDICMSL